MAKIKLRKIVTEAGIYLWHRKHNHMMDNGVKLCQEQLTIYLEGYKKSPLRVYFTESDNKIRESGTGKWCVGYPEAGVIWLYEQNNTEMIYINLNRPAFIVKLIEFFIKEGWKPKQLDLPFEIKEGLKFLEIMDLPYESY
ncbi:MAG: hypothetical protein WBP45_10980 [Daejeonella sp.]